MSNLKRSTAVFRTIELVEQMLTNYVVVGIELSVVVIVGLAIYLIKKK